MQLLLWQNLIFLIPIGFGALYLLLMALGTGFGDHGADVGVDADADMDAGADVGGDAGIDHDAAFDHGDLAHGDVGDGDAAHGDAGHDLHPGVLSTLFGFLGVGKVPISILMMSYCFVWGAAGLVSNAFLGHQRVWPAVAIAALASVVITRQLAIGLSKLIPSIESYHTPQRQLVGLRGDVLYEITESSGMVRVRDAQENLRDVSCRVAKGAKYIPAGNTAVLLSYDSAAQVFYVAS